VSVQAHVARVQTIDEVEALVTALKSNNKIARATHNMLAYRIATQKAGTFLQDYDDDGETAAGSRMLHLLQVCSDHFHLFIQLTCSINASTVGMHALLLQYLDILTI
jgi:putative IMPACT (imprinted ancient) family translation regulator